MIKERRKESNESFVCKSGEMVVGYSDDIDNIGTETAGLDSFNFLQSMVFYKLFPHPSRNN